MILLAMVLALSATAQQSVYHPFPDSNAIWNMHYTMYCFGGGIGDDYYSITFRGDTVINGTSYHRLTTPFIQSNTTGNCGGVNLGYRGAIRQDVAGRKVYFVPPAAASEQLLYDFNLQVGDTVKGYLESWATPKDIVQAIDSVLVGTSYHKRWKINSCYNIWLIEGIGSTYGLTELSPGCITDLADYSIVCFRQNGSTLYPDTTTPCELITSVPTHDQNSFQVSVYPNPSNGVFTITFADPVNVREIRLADLTGHLILDQMITSQSRITIGNLGRGTYLLQVIGQNSRIITRKIIN